MDFLEQTVHGKTTTIRMILGIMKKDAGEITWNGKKVERKNVNFGYLPEERGIYPKTKIYEQLIYFAKLSKDILNRKRFLPGRGGIEFCALLRLGGRGLVTCIFKIPFFITLSYLSILIFPLCEYYCSIFSKKCQNCVNSYRQ